MADVEVELTAHEVELIDLARGELSREEFIVQAAMRAAVLATVRPR